MLGGQIRSLEFEALMDNGGRLTDGRKDGRKDGRTEERTEGQTEGRTVVWKFPPVFYRTSALLHWIIPSRASGTADHVRSLDD